MPFSKLTTLAVLFLLAIPFCSPEKRAQPDNALLQEIARCQELYRDLEGKYKLEFLSDQITIDDLTLIDTKGEEGRISEWLKADHTLLFYFANNSCSPCIEDYLTFLSKYSNEKGKDNMIILSNYENPRPMIVKKSNHQSKIPHFITKERFDIPMNTTDRIAFFVLLSKDLKTHFPRFAEVKDSISTLYFDKVLSFGD